MANLFMLTDNHYLLYALQSAFHNGTDRTEGIFFTFQRWLLLFLYSIINI